MLVGFAVAGWITDNYKCLTVLPIGKWIIPAGIAFLVFLLFALLFDSKKEKEIQAI
jgi:hypothetical protein